MVSLRQVVASNSPLDCCIKMGSTPDFLPYQIKIPPYRVVFLFGGGEGSRFIMVSLRQAVASNSPPDCCIKMGSTPYLCPDQKIKATQRVAFIFGGGEGSRTPVRKQLGKNFSGRSLLFTFPQAGGNKHPTAFSSFMMHGALKALRTHGLHSDHTRARLVDLPGRMGA